MGEITKVNIDNEKEWRRYIVTKLDSMEESMNKRFRLLENWRSWIMGGLGVITFILIYFVSRTP